MADDPKYRLMDIPGFVINLTARMMRKRFDEALQPFGITSHQFAILMICHHGEAETPNDIAAILGIDNAAVTGLLDRMEKKDMLKREANPDDRRSVFVRLTKEGTALANKVVGVPLMTGSRALAGLSDDEKKAMMKALSKIRDNVAPPRDQGR